MVNEMIIQSGWSDKPLARSNHGYKTCFFFFLLNMVENWKMFTINCMNRRDYVI